MWAIDLFSKYSWAVPLKDKIGITTANAFQKIISKGWNPSKMWVDQVVNFTIIFSKDFWKIVTLKCTQHAMKESPLMLKDLLELWKKGF